jgi:hypothetical protein
MLLSAASVLIRCQNRRELWSKVSAAVAGCCMQHSAMYCVVLLMQQTAKIWCSVRLVCFTP